MTFCWKVHHCSQITKCLRQVSLVALFVKLLLHGTQFLLLYSVHSLLHAFYISLTSRMVFGELFISLGVHSTINTLVLMWWLLS